MVETSSALAVVLKRRLRIRARFKTFVFFSRKQQSHAITPKSGGSSNSHKRTQIKHLDLRMRGQCEMA